MKTKQGLLPHDECEEWLVENEKPYTSKCFPAPIAASAHVIRRPPYLRV